MLTLDDIDVVGREVLEQYKSGLFPVQPWIPVEFEPLQRVHTEFVELGFIRSEKLLERLIDDVVKNILRLQVNTELMEHTPLTASEAASHYDFDLSDAEIEGFSEWCVDEKGSWRISDYGLDKLLKLVSDMEKTYYPDQRLVLLNRMLNVAHQRSDLAGWLVQGGTVALSELSEMPETENKNVDLSI